MNKTAWAGQRGSAKPREKLMFMTQLAVARGHGDETLARPKHQAKICLLGATFGTPNMGVGALTACAIKCALSQFPSAQVFLLDYGREATVYRLQVEGKEIEVPLINMRFSKRIYLKNHIAVLLLLALLARLIPFRSIKEYLISLAPLLRRIRQADVAAAISGGDSFSDLYGLGRFFYISLPLALVLLMDKRLILLPQTLGPFRSGLARGVARWILTGASAVYSRDYAGLELVEALLGRDRMRKKTRFCYDLGFVLDPRPPAGTNWADLLRKQKGKRCVVGLNISGLLFAGGYTGDNMFRLRADYRALVYELIDFLVREKEAVVLLVPHVFGSAADVESDSVISARLHQDLKPRYGNQLSLVEGNYDQSEIKYIIGLCDLFIGSRMHACIAALSQSVPAVGLAYSDKFLGVMRSLELEFLVADLRKLQQNEVFDVVDQAYCERESIRLRLGHKMAEVKSTVLNLFRDIDIGRASPQAERVQ